MTTGTAGTFLTVVATILGGDGSTAILDKGLVHGLQPGDRGSVHYVLTVDSEPQRIEVGIAEVISVAAEQATVTLVSERNIRPTYLVTFELAPTRLSPAHQIAAARSYLTAADAERFVRQLFEDSLAGSDPATEEVLASLLALRQGQRQSSTDPPGTDPNAGMALIPGGRYPIGVDLDQAKHFNQQPRFEVTLDPFWIDLHPATEGVIGGLPGTRDTDPLPSAPITSLTFQEAAAHCHRQGKRLPTEHEWEAAVTHAPPGIEVPLLEWTTSWYLPYPGNQITESQYGESFRTLRGSSAPGDTDPRRRFFLNPDLANRIVGFRCIRTLR